MAIKTQRKWKILWSW